MSAEILTPITLLQAKCDVLEAKCDTLEDKLASIEKRMAVRDSCEWMSPPQVSGMLDIGVNTLMKLPIKRHVVIPNKVVKYLRSEVMAYMATTRE